MGEAKNIYFTCLNHVEGETEEDSEVARSRQSWSRAHRQAQEASRWAWQCWWAASSPHQLRQIPSRVLRQSGNAHLSSQTQQVTLSDPESGQNRQPDSRRAAELEGGKAAVVDVGKHGFFK